MHLDRGYDSNLTRERCAAAGIDDVVCAKKRRRSQPQSKTTKKPLSFGMRWPVERINSWFSNFGQLRRNTDRFVDHCEAQIALAVALILTVKLVKWAERWSPKTG